MKLTSSSTARRSTATAPFRSSGGPQMPSPVRRIAPKPRRCTDNLPPNEILPARRADNFVLLLFKLTSKISKFDGCSSLSFFCSLLCSIRSYDVFVHDTIERERSCSFHDHYHGQCDRQQMIFNPVPSLVPNQFRNKPVPKVHHCDGSQHREYDHQCCKFC